MKNNIHIHTHNFNRKTIFFLSILCVTLCGAGAWFIQDKRDVLPKQVSSSKEMSYQNLSGEIHNSLNDPIELENIPNIKKPNSAWKPRTITLSDGRIVTYRFGEGNPEEVALNQEKLREYLSTVDPITEQTPYGYMTRESEEAMKTFLDNPSLIFFLNSCYKLLDLNHERRENLQEWEKYPNNFSMELFLKINPRTGLKEWDWYSISLIATGFSSLDSPISDAWKSCMSPEQYQKHLKPLHAQFSQVLRSYIVQE